MGPLEKLAFAGGDASHDGCVGKMSEQVFDFDEALSSTTSPASHCFYPRFLLSCSMPSHQIFSRSFFFVARTVDRLMFHCDPGCLTPHPSPQLHQMFTIDESLCWHSCPYRVPVLMPIHIFVVVALFAQPGFDALL